MDTSDPSGGLNPCGGRFSATSLQRHPFHIIDRRKMLQPLIKALLAIWTIWAIWRGRVLQKPNREKADKWICIIATITIVISIIIVNYQPLLLLSLLLFLYIAMIITIAVTWCDISPWSPFLFINIYIHTPQTNIDVEKPPMLTLFRKKLAGNR